MNIGAVLRELRVKKGLSQEELAEKVFVTRQAVSRWETGETVPGTDTLKHLSAFFHVSINTLLGQPRQICQCCGMPLGDGDFGTNRDGSINGEYCKWCYADGTYLYNNMDDLMDVCVKNMVSETASEQQVRAYLKELLPTLNYWKHHADMSDGGKFEAFKAQLAAEINALCVPGMPRVDKLYALVGKQVNLAYPLPGGQTATFLDDEAVYLGTQLVADTGERCFGVLANTEFILLCTYKENGAEPELLLYKKR